MRTATSTFLLLLSSLHKLFVLSQTCISHHGCENLWCLDKRKLDFQVNKLTVDISTNPGKTLNNPYHHPHNRDRLLIPPS